MGGIQTVNRECMAMRLLAREGWSMAALKMCFETTPASVRKHVRGDCSHRSYVAPYTGWTGTVAKSERRYKEKAWEPYNTDVINEPNK